MWTNTCCSHPLSIKSEIVEEGEKGVRRAGLRKLPHELGMKVKEGKGKELAEDDFTYLTKIHYLAPSSGLWGEHEGESECEDLEIMQEAQWFGGITECA